MDETRWNIVGFIPKQTTVLGMGYKQLSARPRDTDVTQASFFLESARFFDRTMVRKQPFFQSTQKHTIKFQSLGGVQGHQLHTVFPALCLTFTGFQCGMRQK